MLGLLYPEPVALPVRLCASCLLPDLSNYNLSEVFDGCRTHMHSDYGHLVTLAFTREDAFSFPKQSTIVLSL